MIQLEQSVRLLTQYQEAVYALAALFGLMIGSFVNVVVFRLPKQLSADVAGEAPGSRSPLLGARSKCPACARTIRWYENIPVMSYLWLKGRCSRCRAKISPRYPLVELLVGVLAVVMLWYFGMSWGTLGRFAFCCILLALALIDLDHFILPDTLTIPAIWVGLAINAFEILAPAREAILGAICGWGILAAINLVYKLVSGRDGIGQGDWKFAAMIGAWLGFVDLLTAVSIAFLIGGAVGIGLLIVYRGGRRMVVPFGPLLAMGGFADLFFGPAVVDWYLNWVVRGSM